MLRVDIRSGNSLFVTFILREFLCIEDKVWQIFGELRNNDLSVFVVNVIVLKSLFHKSAGLRVRDPVVENLVSGQIIVVYTDVVNIRRTSCRPNGNVYRRHL